MADPRTVYYEGIVQNATPAASVGLAVTVSSGTATPASSGAGNGVIEDIGTGLAGSRVKVVQSGPARGLLSATVAAGAKLTADASGGQLEAAASTEVVVAIALEAGDAGDLIRINVSPGFNALS